MKNRRLVMRRAMSWLLTAVMTVGMLSATGITAGAETVAQTGAATDGRGLDLHGRRRKPGQRSVDL